MIEEEQGYVKEPYVYKVRYYWLTRLVENVGPQIQETSEPIVENGAVLEENPDPTAEFEYDYDDHDRPRSRFVPFDDDYDNQGGAFGGFDDDYDDDFGLNSNHTGSHIHHKPLIDRTRHQARAGFL